MKYAIVVDEIRDGAKTFEYKEELKARGYRWIDSSFSKKKWVKEMDTLDEVKAEIEEIEYMGFGIFFGKVINKKFYDDLDAEKMGEMDGKDAREMFAFKYSKKLRKKRKEKYAVRRAKETGKEQEIAQWNEVIDGHYAHTWEKYATPEGDVKTRDIMGHFGK